jgi:UrcA family protein
MIPRISASLLAAGAVMLFAHPTAQAQSLDDHTPRERVVFPSALLQTPDGRETVVRRLRTAARNVCAEADDGLLTSMRPKCERSAFDSAMHQVFPDGVDGTAAATPDGSAG